MNKAKRDTPATPQKTFKKMLGSVWFFPGMLLIPLVTLTLLGISGSSIGAYSLLYGDGYKDPNMLAGSPRGVRSDEWVVSTQMVVAQANNGYARVNQNIGNGQDMSLMGDVPYKEWSSVFKPQNAGFFVLPLDNAYAFRWWFLGFVLVLAAYFFALQLFPKRIFRSALFSLLVGLTPMMFWWYSSGIVLCVAYSLLIIALTMRLLRSKSQKGKILNSLALSYILICFGLLLYPPFQIPCLIAAFVFILGWIFEEYNTRAKFKKLVTFWPYLLLICLLVISTGLLFYFTRSGVIQMLANTAYPGHRVVASGGTEPLLIASSFLSPNLAYDQKAISGYLGNQSEASNFILIAPFLFLPSLYIIYRMKKLYGKTLWGLIFINGLLALFLARMYLHVTWFDPIYNLFLLGQVPNTRLLLGVGFAGILQLILVIKALDTLELKKREQLVLAIVGSLSGLVVMLSVGLYTVHHFPVFIASPIKVAVFSGWIAVSIFLILYKKTIAGLVLLVAFSFLSVYKVHPLYQGLDPVTDSPITNAINHYPENGKWVVLTDRLLINFPVMAGRHSLNSVQYYPQLKLWSSLNNNSSYNPIYNRYAHIVFVEEDAIPEDFSLKHTDTVLVKFVPCSNFFQKNARYVLSPKKLPENCLTLRQKIDLPTPHADMYIYEVKPVSKV